MPDTEPRVCVKVGVFQQNLRCTSSARGRLAMTWVPEVLHSSVISSCPLHPRSQERCQNVSAYILADSDLGAVKEAAVEVDVAAWADGDIVPLHLQAHFVLLSSR